MREDVFNEFEKQAVRPPANDVYIAAFSRAVLQRIENEDGESEMIRILTQEHRRDRTPSHIANIALRAMQHQLMVPDSTYPREFEQPRTWTERMDEMSGNQELLEILRSDIENRTVQSNITERYKAFKLVISMLGKRIGQAPSIIDIGCSRNLGLKKLQTGLPFGEVALDYDRAESAGINPGVVNVINSKIHEEFEIGPSKGVDIEPLDSDDRTWPRSCSFYPAELLNTAAINEYDYLDQSEIDNVAFLHADITDSAAMAQEQDKYDVVTASTFLYMLSENERVDARNVMRSLLKPHGVIIYQDFARPQDGSGITFEENWFNETYLYRTLVEFANDPKHNCYEVIRWENGRCKKWIPGKDFALFYDNAAALHPIK